jgi:hypothetical protein
MILANLQRSTLNIVLLLWLCYHMWLMLGYKFSMNVPSILLFMCKDSCFNCCQIFCKYIISNIVMHLIDSCCEVNDYVTYCTYTYDKVFGFVDFLLLLCHFIFLNNFQYATIFHFHKFMVYVITNPKTFPLGLVSSSRLRLYAI